MSHEVQQEITFWIGVWGLAAISGACRAVRDRDYRDLPSLVSVGLFSGLVGFGIVSVIIGSSGGHSGYEPRYLGMATLLGLMGKEQDKLIRFVIRKMFIATGVINGEEENTGVSPDRMDFDLGPDGSDIRDPPENRLD